MKVTYTLFLSVILSLTAFSYASAQKQTGPVFEAESDEVNYGEIKQNSDRVRVLKFTNKGTEPLMITEAKGSCGCTVPTFPKEPIMPGKSAEISINYDTARLGLIAKSVYITTNEVESRDANGNPVYKVHEIKVKGNISQ